jgi:hypothetical protein
MIGPESQADTKKNFGENDVGDPVAPCQSSIKHHVRLVQMAGKDFPAVVAAGKTSRTHDFYKNVHRASRDELLEQMRAAEDGDIFTSDTHTYKPVANALGILGWALSEDTSDVVFTSQMSAALASGTPPTAAVIIGCKSNDVARLLIPGSGVKVAMGVESMAGDIQSTVASGAAEAVTAALMSGKTIVEAKAAGDGWVGSTGHSIELHVATGVDPSKSLEGNGLV